MGNALDDHVRAYQGENIYDFDNLIQLKWYPERIAQFSSGTASLLELGLGHGITADAFGRHFKRHVVIDASPAVIENFQAALSPNRRPRLSSPISSRSRPMSVST